MDIIACSTSQLSLPERPLAAQPWYCGKPKTRRGCASLQPPSDSQADERQPPLHKVSNSLLAFLFGYFTSSQLCRILIVICISSPWNRRLKSLFAVILRRPRSSNVIQSGTADGDRGTLHISPICSPLSMCDILRFNIRHGDMLALLPFVAPCQTQENIPYSALRMVRFSNCANLWNRKIRGIATSRVHSSRHGRRHWRLWNPNWPIFARDCCHRFGCYGTIPQQTIWVQGTWDGTDDL